MMGYSHATTGMAGWLALTSSSGLALGIYHPGTTAAVFAGSILCAGAAMAPDADHPQASIAHSLPPLTKWITSGIGFISGGHRHGTHSLVGVAAFTLFALLASWLVIEVDGRSVALGSGLLAVFLTAFATKSLGLHQSFGKSALGSILGTKVGPWIIALSTAGVATWYMDERWSWLPVCMGVGTLIHILGDWLTVQGVPWLWPWNPKPPKFVAGTPLGIFWQRNGYFRFPILGKTKEKMSWQEGLFVGLVSLYAIYLFVYEVSVLFGQPNMLL